jgi:hypothetical protein
MFTRFRATPRRLQVSIVETRRIEGRVRHEHVAGLGAARLPLSPETRLEFWEKLHPRLVRLANRLDGEAHAKILAAVHERIPMVTGDERRALQLEAARGEAKFWEVMQESNEEMSLGHHGLAIVAERNRTQTKQAAENAAKHVVTAKDRIARLEHGEDIGGTTKIDIRKLFRDVGVTDSDIRHYGVVSRIHELGAEREYLDAIGPNEQRERRAARKILRAAEQRKRGVL